MTKFWTPAFMAYRYILLYVSEEKEKKNYQISIRYILRGKESQTKGVDEAGRLGGKMTVGERRIGCGRTSGRIIRPAPVRERFQNSACFYNFHHTVPTTSRFACLGVKAAEKFKHITTT